jgi:hypothetical protein
MTRAPCETIRRASAYVINRLGMSQRPLTHSHADFLTDLNTMSVS